MSDELSIYQSFNSYISEKKNKNVVKCKKNYTIKYIINKYNLVNNTINDVCYCLETNSLKIKDRKLAEFIILLIGRHPMQLLKNSKRMFILLEYNNYKESSELIKVWYNMNKIIKSIDLFINNVKKTRNKLKLYYKKNDINNRKIFTNIYRYDILPVIVALTKDSFELQTCEDIHQNELLKRIIQIVDFFGIELLATYYRVDIIKICDYFKLTYSEKYKYFNTLCKLIKMSSITNNIKNFIYLSELNLF